MKHEGVCNKIPYGNTIHGFYGPPIPVTMNSSCRIEPTSPKVACFWTVHLFINDDFCNKSKLRLKATGRCPKDIKGNHGTSFCDKVFFLGGNFTQTLPIGTTGNVNAPFEKCHLISNLYDNYRTFNFFLEKFVREWKQDFLQLQWNTRKGTATIPGTIQLSKYNPLTRISSLRCG